MTTAVWAAAIRKFNSFLMTQQAARAEQKLYTLMAEAGIGEDAKAWLDHCLDPCKDVVYRQPSGFPDALTSPSIVQVVSQAFDITVPGSAGSGAWDCNIFLDQLWSVCNLKNSTSYTDVPNVFSSASQSSGIYQRGGVQVRSGPSGATLNTTTGQGGFPYENDFFLDSEGYPSGRIIALGLEVHNVTEVLNISGALTTYRVPQPLEVEGSATFTQGTIGSTCASSTLETVDLIEPPTTLDSATQLPGSISWEAAKGAYVVATLVGENKPQIMDVVCPVVFESSTGATYIPPISIVGSPTGGQDVAAIRVPDIDTGSSLGTAPIDWSLCGVYLTGLSNETKLHVNVKYSVEVFPDTTSVLRRSTRPSPGLDAAAFKFYNSIRAALPTGVPVEDNFLGAFVAAIAAIGNAVMSAAPHIARGIATVAPVVGAAYDAYKMIDQPKNQKGQWNNSDKVKQIIYRETPPGKTSRQKLPTAISMSVPNQQNSSQHSNWATTLVPVQLPSGQVVMERVQPVRQQKVSVVSSSPPRKPKKKRAKKGPLAFPPQINSTSTHRWIES